MVDYESIAVYGLAIQLAIFGNNGAIATQMQDRIMRLAAQQSLPEWRGALCQGACHSFDHLQALLAFLTKEAQKS